MSDCPTARGTASTWSTLRDVLPEIGRFRPEVLFYQSGVDGLAGDRLGRLALTHAGLMARDRTVFEFSRKSSIPIVVTLGGGYSDPIAATVEAHANTFRTAAAVFGPCNRSAQDYVLRIRGFLRLVPRGTPFPAGRRRVLSSERPPVFFLDARFKTRAEFLLPNAMQFATAFSICNLTAGVRHIIQIAHGDRALPH